MVDNARRIAQAVGVPVIADADTGYGNALNVIRTVREYEAAGVAAVHLEGDAEQANPEDDQRNKQYLPAGPDTEQERQAHHRCNRDYPRSQSHQRRGHAF